MAFSRSVKNCVGILMGIALNLQVAFGREFLFPGSTLSSDLGFLRLIFVKLRVIAISVVRLSENVCSYNSALQILCKHLQSSRSPDKP